MNLKSTLGTFAALLFAVSCQTSSSEKIQEPSPSSTPIVAVQSLSPTAVPTVSPTMQPTSQSTPQITIAPTPQSTQQPTFQPANVIQSNSQIFACVPILTYHHIGYLSPNSNQQMKNLTVTPERFEQQLISLKINNANVILLSDLYEYLKNGKSIPKKSVIITIDDGYDDGGYDRTKNTQTYAFALLQKYGYKATFFVITDFVGTTQDDNKYMTWQQIEEMSNAGQNIEPHTKTHPSLQNRTRDFLLDQIGGSKRVVQEHTGKEPKFFAYPSGVYDGNDVNVLQELGFLGAVSTNDGLINTNMTLYFLNRRRVFDGTSIMSYVNACS